MSFKTIPEEFRKIAVLSMEIQSSDPGRHLKLLVSELMSCIGVCGGETRQRSANTVIGIFGTGRNAEQACRRAVDSGFRMMKTIDLVNNSIETERAFFTGRSGIISNSAPVDMNGKSETASVEESIALSLALAYLAEPGTILVSEEAKISCGDFCTWKAAEKGTWDTGGEKGPPDRTSSSYRRSPPWKGQGNRTPDRGAEFLQKVALPPSGSHPR